MTLRDTLPRVALLAAFAGLLSVQVSPGGEPSISEGYYLLAKPFLIGNHKLKWLEIWYHDYSKNPPQSLAIPIVRLRLERDASPKSIQQDATCGFTIMGEDSLTTECGSRSVGFLKVRFKLSSHHYDRHTSSSVAKLTISLRGKNGAMSSVNSECWFSEGD